METRVEVRATDTGGNTTLSNRLVFELVPDTFCAHDHQRQS